MRTLVVLVATVGGVGYMPVAPGTFGSLVAVPLLPLLAGLRVRAPLAGWLAVAARRSRSRSGRPIAPSAIFGGHDHRRIVIDEVAGMIVAGLFVPGTWARGRARLRPLPPLRRREAVARER